MNSIREQVTPNNILPDSRDRHRADTEEQGRISRELWLQSTFTQELLNALDNQRLLWLSETAAQSYNLDGAVNNNKLTKAETLRKTIQYARTGKTDW